jgi:hypothetical protein
MREIRTNCPFVSPETLKSAEAPLGIVDAMIVELVPAPLVEGPVFGVPDPMIEMPTPETVIPEFHVQFPDGIMIVSPLTAVCVGPLMTAFTSAVLHDAAVYVPCAASESGKSSISRNEILREDFMISTTPVQH